MRLDRNRVDDALLGWILSTLVLAAALLPAYVFSDRDRDLFSNNWDLFGNRDQLSFITMFDYVAMGWIVVTIYRLCTLFLPASADRPLRLATWLYRGSIAFFAVGYLNFIYHWLPRISACKNLPVEDGLLFARTCTSYQAGLVLISVVAIALLVASLLVRTRQPRQLEGTFE